MPFTNNNGQTRVGVRISPLVSQVTTSSLWNSIYSVYNADSVGSSSLKTSLYAAYNFDNNLNDSFGTNNGTGFGGINYGTTSGLIGTSIGFNGANAYVNLPNNTGQFNFTDDFSISLWVKPSTTAGFPFLINNYVNIGSNNYGYYLFITSTGLRLGIWNGASSAITDVNQLPAVNVWSNIVITRKKSTITKIYINGVLTTPTSSTNPTLNATYQPNTIMTLGASFGNYKYTGWMDAVNFYQKELTQSEITELYNSGNGAQYIGNDFYKPNTNDALGTNNGTAQGGLTYDVGKVGTAFVGNGTNAYVNMGDVMDIGTSSWSYAMWFNPTTFTTQTIFGKTIAAGVRGRIFCQLDGDKLVVGFDADATNVIIVQTPILGLNLGTWYHVVVQIDRSDKLKIYVNNTLLSLTTTNGANNLTPYSATNYNTNNPFRIGAYTSADNVSAFQFFNGKIDAFNVWNKVLTQSEITELYNAGNGKQYPN